MSRAIAIDGPAASGKSSVAKLLSKKLNLVMVNSGSMYRAVAWRSLQLGINHTVSDELDAPELVSELQCGVDETGLLSTVGYDGKILEDAELRTDKINGIVSSISSHHLIRERLLEKQRNYLQHSDVVMEGRDIGTVIFPETPYKFFFKACEKIRQQRRDAEGVQDSIAQRDHQDSNRKTAPLKPADDAFIIDTGIYTVEQVASLIESHLKEDLNWK